MRHRREQYWWVVCRQDSLHPHKTILIPIDLTYLLIQSVVATFTVRVFGDRQMVLGSMMAMSVDDR